METCNKVKVWLTCPETHEGDRPTGYWISPEINFGEHVWELDIWLQIPQWNTGNTEQYATALKDITDEQKVTILSLKETLMKNGIYGVGKEFVSVDVYDGVLNAGVTDVSALRRYKNS